MKSVCVFLINRVPGKHVLDPIRTPSIKHLEHEENPVWPLVFRIKLFAGPSQQMQFTTTYFLP